MAAFTLIVLIINSKFALFVCNSRHIFKTNSSLYILNMPSKYLPYYKCSVYFSCLNRNLDTFGFTSRVGRLAPTLQSMMQHVNTELFSTCSCPEFLIFIKFRNSASFLFFSKCVLKRNQFGLMMHRTCQTLTDYSRTPEILHNDFAKRVIHFDKLKAAIGNIISPSIHMLCLFFIRSHTRVLSFLLALLVMRFFDLILTEHRGDPKLVCSFLV